MDDRGLMDMIDEKLTLEKFGYRSDQLTFYSKKRVVRVCDICGWLDDVRYDNQSFSLCHTCTNRISTKKRFEDPKERKKLSDATKKSHKDDPTRAVRQGKSLSERLKDHDLRMIYSEAQKKRYGDPKERKKTSDANKKSYKDDPQRTIRQTKSITGYYENHPEAIEIRSKIMKKRYENPEEHKKTSAAMQEVSMDDWSGFLSFGKYCSKFNRLLKIEIREKYNDCDYISGIHKSICNIMNGRVYELDVHHIDYDKMQGCDDKKWCLVPLSRINHLKTNKNRPFWNKLFIYALNYDKEYYKL